MNFTKYGKDVLITSIAIALVLFGLGLWAHEIWLRSLLILVGLAILVFSLNFFRDPEREIERGAKDIDNLVVSPADGKVVVVKQVRDDQYLHEDAMMISIFMSPLDVHVNRSPMTGVVEYFKYVKGEFLVAHSDESSHRNERAIIGLNSNGRKVLFSQVAGYIARRIVCPVREGDRLQVGQRFGMIKFGSRVDVLVPHNANVTVHVGDVVKSGQSVLAELM